MKRPRSDALGAAFFVLFASACFATSGPVARLARPAEPLFVAFARVGIASLLLTLVGPVALWRTLRSLEFKQFLLVVAAGIILGAHFALFLVGLDETSVAAAVSLVSLEPLSVVFAAWAIFGVRPTSREAIGVCVATVGAVVVGSAAGQGEHRLQGDLYVLASVALYGLYVAAARGVGPRVHPRSYAALVYGIAALAVAVAVALLPSASFPAPESLPPRSWLCIVTLAVVPTLLGHTSVQMAARRLSPSIVALASPGETVGAIALGAFALAAPPSSVELVGAIVIVAGSALTLFGRKAP